MSYVGFNKLEGQLAQRPGVTNPGALAAHIGAEKYGPEAMQHGAATGKSLRGHKTRRKHSKRHAAIARFVKHHGGQR